MRSLIRTLLSCGALAMLVRQSNAQTVSKSKPSSAVPVAQLDASKIHTWILPPFHINGKSAKAHTQGLLVHQNGFFVTARRDDINPRRSLLLWLRCNPSSQKENCNESKGLGLKSGILRRPPSPRAGLACLITPADLILMVRTFGFQSHKVVVTAKP